MKLQVKFKWRHGVWLLLGCGLLWLPVLARAQAQAVNAPIGTAAAPSVPASSTVVPANADDLNNPVKRQALKEELAKLPPAERKAKMAELRQQKQQELAQKLAIRKQKFQDRWNKATPAERQKFCSNVTTRCATKGANNEACNFAKSTCSGQNQ